MNENVYKNCERQTGNAERKQSLTLMAQTLASKRVGLLTRRGKHNPPFLSRRESAKGNRRCGAVSAPPQKGFGTADDRHASFRHLQFTEALDSALL